MLRLLRQSQPTTTMMTRRGATSNLSPANSSFTSRRRNHPSSPNGLIALTINNNNNNNSHHYPSGSKLTGGDHRYSSTLTAAAAAASANSLSWGGQLSSSSSSSMYPNCDPFIMLNRERLLHHHHHQYQNQIKRFYFYIPTSWTELKLRMMRDKEEIKAPRKVIVKLHQFWNKHYGAAKKAAKIKASVDDKKAKIKASVAANRKQGREWLEKQQQQFLVLRSNFKGRRRRFYRKRFKEPLLQWATVAAVPGSTSSLNTSSRHIDLALVRRHRGQWVVSPPTQPDYLSITATAEAASPPPHRFVVKVKEYSEASWFDAASGRPLVSRDETGRFVNPWQSQSSDGVHPISSIIKWRQIRLAREWSAFWAQNNVVQRWIRPILNYYYDLNSIFSSSTQTIIGAQQVATAGGETGTLSSDQQKHTTTITPKSCTLRKEEDQKQLAESTLRFTWIGHATCLLQQGDISILTDPIFSAHASPLPPLLAPFMGVARHVPPLRVSSSQQQHHDDDEDDDGDDGKTVILPDKIDVCLISHDHYDHLDLPSVQQLADRVSCWVVPIGIGEFLQRHACIPAHRIVELEWWETAKLVRKPTFNQKKNDGNNDDPDSGDDVCEHDHDWRCVQIHSLHERIHDNCEQEQASPPSLSMTSHHQHHPARLDPANTNQLWITATPVQHWASRTMLDRNYRLWAGFCVFMDQQQTFFFAGDTAFPQEFPLFEQVADYIASAKITATNNYSNIGNDDIDDDDDDDDNKTIVDLAALPIGAYKPRFLNHTSHMEPKDALRVHEILQCRQSVAIHHGTFCLSEEPPEEPPQLLREAVAAAAIEQQQQQQQGIKRNAAALNFVAIPHGGCINLEPVSAPPPVDAVKDGRNVVVEGDHENGEEEDDNDERNNNASALG